MVGSFVRLFDSNRFGLSDYCKKLESGLADCNRWGYPRELEKLWEKYENYAPPDFQKHFLASSKPDAFIWEMLLANQLLEAGFNLRRTRSSNEPDLCIELDDKKIWIECSLPTQGKQSNPDRVVEPPSDGEFHEIFTKNSLLRCTQCLKEKRSQHQSFLSKGICSEKDGFVIALNGKNLQMCIGNESLPDILGALYAMGDKSLIWSPKSPAHVTSHYSRRDAIVKTNRSEVPTTFFLENENKLINGVLFSDLWIRHFSNRPKNCYVHNVNSDTDYGFLFQSLCQTYEYTNNSIRLKK